MEGGAYTDEDGGVRSNLVFYAQSTSTVISGRDEDRDTEISRNILQTQFFVARVRSDLASPIVNQTQKLGNNGVFV